MAKRRSALVVAGLLLAVAACSGGGGNSDVEAEGGSGGTAEVIDPPQVAGDEPESTVSALDDRFDERLPEPLIDPAEIRSGGPPPDGIPPIDRPKFERADSVDWLEPTEPVLSLTVEDETRAYPLRVMTWHEIVNDTVGGVPVTVTYCPLCNSGVAFLREIDGRVFTFGTSGMLYADNLVMYDRQTQSLWPQLTGQASVGELTGLELEAIPMGTVAWRDFRKANPDSLVLSQDTGFDRPYGQNPYLGYDNPDGGLLFELPTDLDDRLLVKERVIGLEAGESSVAIVRDSLEKNSPIEVSVGDQVVTVWHQPGQASALDTREIAEGQEVGSVGVFEPVADGRELTFTSRGDQIVDEETGSRWNILGEAVAGPLKGARLTPFRHLDTFWFAWVTFHPDTEIVDPAKNGQG